MPGVRRVVTVALLAAVSAGAGCRDATQIEIVITTDASCVDVTGISITKGKPGTIEESAPTTETKHCDGGRIGSLVFVPSDDDSASFLVRVVGGIGKTPDECVADDYQGGCIVARRQLRFVPHESLTIPIALKAACLNVACDDTHTCVDGKCVSATSPTPVEDAGTGGTGGADASCTLGVKDCADSNTVRDCDATGPHLTTCPTNAPFCNSGTCAQCALDEHCPSPASICSAPHCESSTGTCTELPAGPDVVGRVCGVGEICNATGGCVPQPSCIGIPTDCGASHTQNCCSSGEVSGGTFFFGRSQSGGPDACPAGFTCPSDEVPEVSATVSTFSLDLYEVTPARFRKFVQAFDAWRADGHPSAGEGAHPLIPNSGWQSGWLTGNADTGLVTTSAALAAAVKEPNCAASFGTYSDQPGANDRRPLTCVSWFEAFAFCLWDGGRLATELEHSYASAGGAEERVFPWSSPPNSAVLDSSYASYYDPVKMCVGDGVDGCSIADLVEVGTKTKGVGRWGQFELGGNVGEWQLDYWHAALPTSCTNCADLVASPFHMARGGTWRSNTGSALRAANRTSFDVAGRGFNLGARCARLR